METYPVPARIAENKRGALGVRPIAAHVVSNTVGECLCPVFRERRCRI